MKVEGYITIAFLLFIPLFLGAQSYKTLWENVENAENKNLPKTVMQWTQAIFKKAEKENNIGQLYKAGVYTFNKQLAIEPDSLISMILKGEERLKKLNDPIEKAFMHSLLAEVYFYAGLNYNVNSRTAIVEELDVSKLKSWGANQIVKVMLQHLDASLEPKELLLTRSGKEYLPFFELRKSSDSFNHDLYHVLAFKRINLLKGLINRYYREGSTGEYRKEVVEKCLDKAYEEFIETYKEKDNAVAQLFVKLNRYSLDYKQDEDLEQLDQWIDEYKAYPEVVEVYEKKAQYYNYREPKKALEVCNEALSLYPNYYRINTIEFIKSRILQPQLNLYTANIVYPEKEFELNITHRNISACKIQWYKIDPKDYDKELSNKQLLSKARLFSSQEYKLLSSADYLQKDTTLTLVAPPLGMYLLNVTVAGERIVNHKRIPMIVSTRFKGLYVTPDANSIELTIVDNYSGHPIPNALVSFYDKKRNFIKSVETDAKGMVYVKRDKSEPTFYRVTDENDKAMTFERMDLSTWSKGFSSEDKQIELLTDRMVYRPGQTLYIKGVLYNSEGNNYQILANQSLDVQIYDASYKELIKEKVQTNAYGSFTFNYTLPSSTMNGMFSIKTPYGSTSVRVEEYKRPSFELTLDTLQTSYQLGDELLLTGIAQTFSGVPITEGEVNYTFTRAFQSWRFFPGNRQTLNQSKVSLNDKGEFAIPVELIADDNDPIWGYYNYTLEVSLTNVAGETQTESYSLFAGKRSLMITSGLEGTICKDQSINTQFKATNLNQKEVDAIVKVLLYENQGEKDWDESTAKKVYEQEFDANQEVALNWSSIPSNKYKLILISKDNQNREVRFEQDIRLFSYSDPHPPVDEGIWLQTITDEFDEETPAKIAFGTADKDSYVFYEIYDAKKRIERKELKFNNSFEVITIPYLPEYKDGVVLSFCYVKEGQIYDIRKELKKRIKEDRIQVKWEVFRDRLTPGQKEEWKVVLLDKEGKPVDAEFLALMYDASLDKIWKYNKLWKTTYRYVLPYIHYYSRPDINTYISLAFKQKEYKIDRILYDTYLSPIVSSGFFNVLSRGLRIKGSSLPVAVQESAVVLEDNDSSELVFFEEEVVEMKSAVIEEESLRSDFAETAFFYPQLRTNEKGEITFSFTVPEQLTRWNFKGYAHSKNMELGELLDQVVTAKEFSIQPYFPRFVRQGDRVVLSSVLTNQSDQQESGTVSFVLFDPYTDKVIGEQKQSFSVEAKATQGVSFTFDTPEEYNVVACRIIAKGKNFSDGEQQALPILSRRVALTESETFIIRDKSEKQIALNNLFNEGSSTATHKEMTLEFSGNPTWLAIQTLPVLQQPQSENAISWAAALYANEVSSYILNSNPTIKTTLDAWQKQNIGKEDLLTPLMKNSELKNLILEESPWLLDAKTEAEQQARLQTLFDMNQVLNNRYTAELRLKELQQWDGGWSWFKGMSGSKYITSFVMETLIRLDKLVGHELSNETKAMKDLAINYLHREGKIEYEHINQLKTNRLTDTGLRYLYLVALGKLNVPNEYKVAYDEFVKLAPSFLKEGTIAQKAKAAYVLNYNGMTKEAKEIMASLKEYLVQTEEKGMYFSQLDGQTLWGANKIASHVYALEAFDEIMKDEEVVNEMKLWLLSQKRTQQWESPISTVDAVYALMFRGRDDFSATKKITLSYGKETIDVQKYSLLPSVAYVKKEIEKDKKGKFPKELKIKQENKGIAWGAVYAQFQEDVAQVKTQGKELKVEKQLYVERLDNGVKMLMPLNVEEQLRVGDVVVSRLILTTDRALDFVHLKDERGACFEPIETLSGYQWGRELAYYLEVKDASTNYYIDPLPKGVKVIENRYRVARQGEYEGGIATLQSVYVPEFTSYAASQRVIVKE